MGKDVIERHNDVQHPYRVEKFDCKISLSRVVVFECRLNSTRLSPKTRRPSQWYRLGRCAPAGSRAVEWVRAWWALPRQSDALAGDRGP